MFDDVHARGGLHRRHKRGYIPATLFTDFGTATQDSTDAVSTPTPATSSDPVQATPTPEQSSSTPATSSAAPVQSSATPAPAAQTSASSTSAAPAPSSSSTSSSSSTQVSSTSQQQAALGPSVPVVTVTNSRTSSFHSATSLSLSASATASAGNSSASTGTDTTSSVQAPVVIGIVVAVIAGIAGIIFAVTYFMRRNRNDDSDEVFRRQSMVLPDDPPIRNGGGRPESTMEERSVPGGGPVSFGGAQNYYDQSYNGYGGNQDMFSPGQVMPASVWSPNTPHTSQPFFQPMGESPMASPTAPAHYDSAYNDQGQLVRQPSMGAAAYLNRQPSSGAMLNRQPSYGPEAGYAQHPYGPEAGLTRQPSYGAEAALGRQPSNGAQVMYNQQPGYGPGSPFEPSVPSPVVTRQSPVAAMSLNTPTDAHYVDLNRSSVSPFQAAQYAEISSRLKTEVPVPLPTPVRVAAADQIISQEGPVSPTVRDPHPLNVISPVIERRSPFADPNAYERGTFGEQDFPQPPSPTYSSKSARVDSSPPKLPEITIQQRAFSPTSMDFPMTPSARPSPSPLASSFDIPSPPVEAHFGDAQANVPPSNANSSPAPRPAKAGGARPDTVYTIYDDDDAYAGI